MRYGAYLFPGVIVLIALFSAIFSTISVIEDRKSGFLQGVLAAPVPGAAIVLAKMVAGTALAFAQAIIFMGLLPLAGVSITAEGAALSALALAFIGMTLTNVGFIISWRMTSTQGFHAIMNLLLIPAWVLSGAFFPPEGAAGWLQWIITLNPLYYISALFREAFWFGMPHASTAPGAAVAAVVSVLTFCVLTAVSLRVVRVR
jgi:ABC-2 type transport system permease protein